MGSKPRRALASASLMQLPVDESTRQAGPPGACSDPPPPARGMPTFALLRSVIRLAAHASTTPAPMAGVDPPTGRAVVINRCLTWFGVSEGLRPTTIAATPETTAVENDVPEPLA